MKKDGLQRVLDFLDTLEKENVEYKIDQQRPEAIMVILTLVGLRVEVDFFVDRMAYSMLQRARRRSQRRERLMDLIKEHSGR